MESVLSLPHALIISIITAIFFTGMYVLTIKNTASSLIKTNDKLDKINDKIDSNNTITNQKIDSFVMTQNIMQVEQNHQLKLNEREFEIFKEKIAAVIVRLSVVENIVQNEKKEHNAKIN